MQLEVVSPAQIEIGVIRANLRVAGHIVRARIEEVRAIRVRACGNRPWLTGIRKNAYAQVEQMFRIEHAVETEMLPLLPICRTPFGVGIKSVFRKPGDAAGVVAIVAPGIPGKAGEAFVEPATIVDVESAAILHAL